MKQKAFFIIFKGLSIKQITQPCLEGESPTVTIVPKSPKWYGWLSSEYTSAFMHPQQL